MVSKQRHKNSSEESKSKDRDESTAKQQLFQGKSLMVQKYRRFHLKRMESIIPDNRSETR